MSSLEILAKQTLPDKSEFALKGKQYEMSDDEMSEAWKTLNIRGVLKKYTSKERYMYDPQYRDQTYCLHSFIPSKGAKPNDDGVYGWIKCRGTFSSPMEMDQQAETIIRTYDSFHHLYHGKVGYPFPMTFDAKYVDEDHKVDINQVLRKDIADDMKTIKEHDKEIIESVKKAEENLLKDVDPEVVKDPIDDYITKRVKKATLVYTLINTRKKMDTMLLKLKETDDAIKSLDKENVAYKEGCWAKYEQARKSAGILEDVNNKENMVYYIMKDVPDEIYDL